MDGTMQQTEKVIIACYLLDAGLDGASVAGFIQALEDGVAAGEADALQMREEFRLRPAAGLPGGELGEIVRAVVLLADLHDREACLESVSRELGLLQSLTSSDQPHELAARVAVRRIAEVIRSHPVGA
jgi:hypothetical protein